MFSPLVCITIVYTLGIVISKLLPLPLWVVFYSLIVFLFLSTVAYLNKINLSNLILILAFLGGMLAFQIADLPDKNDVAAFTDKGYFTISGMVDGDPRKKEESLSFPFKLEKLKKGKNEQEINGTIYVSLSAGSDPIAYGDKLKIRGTIAKSENYFNPLLNQNKEILFLRANWYEKLPGNQGAIFKSWAIWFGQKFNQGLLNILPQKEASLLGSVLLGSSVSPLPEEMKSDYRKAGLIHLLVVSGTQVSILIGVCLAIMRAMGLPLWLNIAITSFFNFMLVIVTGAGPSIIRAAIMGEITLLGLFFERSKEFYTALAISALVLLLVDPRNLFDIGFQLSFAATFSLVYLVPVLEKKIPSMLAVSLGPILVTMPIIAYYFSQIAFGAIISNLLVLPWVEALVILGFSTTLVSFICLPLAQLLGGTIWFMLVLLDLVVRLVTNIPGTCFYIKSPSSMMVFIYYLGLVTMTEKLKKDERIKWSLKLIGFLFLLLVALGVWDNGFIIHSLGKRELTVTFLDVGQGDCALIETPENKTILIDGGGREAGKKEKADYRDPIGVKVVVPFLQKKGINRLDLVILTHPHLDHLGGLNEVLSEFKVDELIDSGRIYQSMAYKRFKALIAANNIKYHLARAGQTLRFSSGLSGKILNPSQQKCEDLNSDSVVMRLVYGRVSFLLTGDLGNEGEEHILQQHFDLRSDILKVGHHGSATSTSSSFLQAVQPRIAVISVGEHNRYHHPAKSTIKKLAEARIRIYRTDLNGAITVKSDGQTYSIESQK